MQRKWFYYGIAGLASIIYLGLFLFAPPNPSAARLGLSHEQILFLQFTIAVPYIVTWFFAMYGLYKLGRYIQVANGKHDDVISLLSFFWKGIFWVAMGTICVALIGGLRPYFRDTTIYPIITIIMNYFYIFPSFIGFLILSRGVFRLGTENELAQYKRTGYLLNTIIVLFISIFYLYLLFTNPVRNFSSDPAINATYYLPDIVILLTIVIPLIITWWLGFYVAFAVGDLIPLLTRAEFFKGISRILYGIWAIIFTSILLQSLLSLGNERLLSIGLGLLLLIIYVFVILQAIGYYFIALGANTLLKSEESKTHKSKLQITNQKTG